MLADQSATNRRPDLNYLIRLAREGQKSAETELLACLRVRFVTIAKYYVGETTAEDIAQDACLVVLRKYRELATDVDFTAWAHRVLRNTIGSQLRYLSVRRRHMNQGIDIDNVAETRTSPEVFDTLDRLRTSLVRLGEAYPQQASALRMALQGYSTEEICREQKITRGHLYVVLYRARRWLAKNLASKRVEP